MHGFAVCLKEGLPFAQNLFLENSADSYLCFWLTLLHSVCYFFLYWSPSSSLCVVFDSISSNIDEVLLINPSANLFVFGDFNAYHLSQIFLLRCSLIHLMHAIACAHASTLATSLMHVKNCTRHCCLWHLLEGRKWKKDKKYQIE